MSEANDENGEEGFEHYTPKHPLPEEIQRMNKDDTVCRYCGVSYLIHNEIKALEKKLKAVQDELEQYRGSEERERKLCERVGALEAQEAELRKALLAKDGVISTLQSDMKSGEEMNRKLCNTNKDLEEKLTESVKNKELLGLKLRTCQSRLPSILSEVKHQRSCLRELHTLVQLEYRPVLDQMAESVLSQVKDKEKYNQKVYEARLRELLTEKSKLEENTKSAEQHSKEQEKKLEKKTAELQDALDRQSAELEKSVSSGRMLTLEVEQFKDNLRVKNQEIEHLNTQLRQNSSSHEEAVHRLQNELEQRRAELQENRKQFKDLTNQLQEQQNLDEEIKRRASLSINQTEELRERLEQAQTELEALKAEREIMIEAHQDRISELKESFKNKMFEAEKWPEKLEAALRKGREKHNADMKALEEKLKENFILEMQIEKQKHRELLQKYLTEHKEKENKYKAEICDLEARLRTVERDHQGLLEDAKKRATETETKLRKEIDNLKSIIRDLEARLAKAGTGSEDKVLSLKEELRQTKDTLQSCQQDVKSAQQQLADKQQEVLFLQETVRKECEERFELTEALGDAREQLLALRRPPGGYSSMSNTSSHTPNKPIRMDSTGSSGSNFSQSSANRPLTNQSGGSSTSPNQYRGPGNQLGGTVTSPAQTQGTGNQSARSSQSYGPITSPDRAQRNGGTGGDVTSSNINMEFKKSPAKPAGKFKGRSIAENRKRITALLGKR